LPSIENWEKEYGREKNRPNEDFEAICAEFIKWCGTKN